MRRLLFLILLLPIAFPAIARDLPPIETRLDADVVPIRPDPAQPFRRLAAEAADRYGLPAALADAVMHVESNYRAGAVGGSGEVGLMQVMPGTARLLGFSGTLRQLADPATNVDLGVRYLAQAWTLAGGDICTAVMKYRAGHGETRFSVRSVDYCERVRAHLASIGYPLTGAVPKPTFGFADAGPRWGFGLGSVGAARRLHAGRKLRSRVGWGAYDARMRSLTAAGRIGL